MFGKHKRYHRYVSIGDAINSTIAEILLYTLLSYTQVRKEARPINAVFRYASGRKPSHAAERHRAAKIIAGEV
jgi:hypothetical protein